MDARTMSLVNPSWPDWQAQEIILLGALKEREHRLDQMRMREIPLMDRERDLRADLARSQDEIAAVKSVLEVVLASLDRDALDRARFRALVAQADRALPSEGPGLARRAVLLAETLEALGCGSSDEASGDPSDPYDRRP